MMRCLDALELLWFQSATTNNTLVHKIFATLACSELETKKDESLPCLRELIRADKAAMISRLMPASPSSGKNFCPLVCYQRLHHDSRNNS